MYSQLCDARAELTLGAERAGERCLTKMLRESHLIFKRIIEVSATRAGERRGQLRVELREFNCEREIQLREINCEREIQLREVNCEREFKLVATRSFVRASIYPQSKVARGN